MKKINIDLLIAWLCFAISLTVYVCTLDPTVSLWDCGEFISAANLLQVVHPPGAPFFLLVGTLMILLAHPWIEPAFKVNLMSAICSAVAVYFPYAPILQLIPSTYKSQIRLERYAGAIGAVKL